MQHKGLLVMANNALFLQQMSWNSILELAKMDHKSLNKCHILLLTAQAPSCTYLSQDIWTSPTKWGHFKTSSR